MDEKLIEKYLLQDDLSTYDPYDIWKTNLGIKVKKLYYKNKYLGLLPAGLLTVFDLYVNNSFRFAYRKQEYPIVRAQTALALLNLYKSNSDEQYLEYAKKHIDWLLNNNSNGYSGYCWGTGFKIVISDKLVYPESMPFSTNTPYILEVLYEYYKLTKDLDILNVIKSIYIFYEEDIKIINENEEILITSYGPVKDRIVTNAVAYTMFSYSIFYNVLDHKDYIEGKIKKMKNFILSVQNDDGSWLYSPYDNNSFIDCFHSAFILKNLIKTNINMKIDINKKNIIYGVNYIKENFLDKKNGLFRRFSLSNKVSLTRFDLYDNGEMLYLFKLMNESEIVINELENSIEKNFYSHGHIFSIIDFLGFKKNKDTLRWAVLPYLLGKSYYGKN